MNSIIAIIVNDWMVRCEILDHLGMTHGGLTRAADGEQGARVEQEQEREWSSSTSWPVPAPIGGLVGPGFHWPQHASSLENRESVADGRAWALQYAWLAVTCDTLVWFDLKMVWSDKDKQPCGWEGWWRSCSVCRDKSTCRRPGSSKWGQRPGDRWRREGRWSLPWILSSGPFIPDLGERERTIDMFNYHDWLTVIVKVCFWNKKRWSWDEQEPKTHGHSWSSMDVWWL